MGISIGKCGRHKAALELLTEGPPPDKASYNACIAACGRSGAWEDAIDILNNMPVELVSQLTCHATLTTLAKAHCGAEALEFLRQMEPTWNVEPDHLSYRLTIQSLIGEGKLDTARSLLDECDDSQSVDILSAAYGKAGRWSDVRDLESGRGKGDLDDSYNTDYFRHWDTMQKVGQGKQSYWELGTLESESQTLSVGFQPNRNPRRNGMRLVLVDSSGCKVGFLLMINRFDHKKDGNSHSVSSLLGLRVEEDERKKGLGKILLAVWIQCCLEAGIRPITGKINKPIIALMLEHNFGFIGSGGVVCEATKHHEYPDRVVLFSSSAKSLEGAFSPWDLQSQRIMLSNTPNGGRAIRVGASWIAPVGPDELPPKVQLVLQDRLRHCLTPSDLRTVLLGTSD